MRSLSCRFSVQSHRISVQAALEIMAIIGSDSAVALFGRTRRSVLALLFGNPDRDFYLREIVKRAGTGTSQIQRELEQLADAGLVIRERRANQVYFRANSDAPIFEELKGN